MEVGWEVWIRFGHRSKQLGGHMGGGCDWGWLCGWLAAGGGGGGGQQRRRQLTSQGRPRPSSNDHRPACDALLCFIQTTLAPLDQCSPPIGSDQQSTITRGEAFSSFFVKKKS